MLVVTDEMIQTWNDAVTQELTTAEDPDFRNFLMRMLL